MRRAIRNCFRCSGARTRVGAGVIRSRWRFAPVFGGAAVSADPVKDALEVIREGLTRWILAAVGASAPQETITYSPAQPTTPRCQ
jgi:hypothetical protein